MISLSSTKDRLYHSALKLFASNSYESVTISSIVNEVGIKESSFYNHYKSKNDLYEYIIEQFSIEFGNKVFDIADLDQLLEECDYSIEKFLFYKRMQIINYFKTEYVCAWRMLLLHKYVNARAFQVYEDSIINIPTSYYSEAFKRLYEKGTINNKYHYAIASEYISGLQFIADRIMEANFNGSDCSQLKKDMKFHIDFFVNALTLIKK